jgi:hypothetical protein
LPKRKNLLLIRFLLKLIKLQKNMKSPVDPDFFRLQAAGPFSDVIMKEAFSPSGPADRVKDEVFFAKGFNGSGKIEEKYKPDIFFIGERKPAVNSDAFLFLRRRSATF